MVLKIVVITICIIVALFMMICLSSMAYIASVSDQDIETIMGEEVDDDSGR